MTKTAWATVDIRAACEDTKKGASNELVAMSMMIEK
jgi:hypothetical protein